MVLFIELGFCKKINFQDFQRCNSINKFKSFSDVSFLLQIITNLVKSKISVKSVKRQDQWMKPCTWSLPMTAFSNFFLVTTSCEYLSIKSILKSIGNFSLMILQAVSNMPLEFFQKNTQCTPSRKIFRLPISTCLIEAKLFSILGRLLNFHISEEAPNDKMIFHQIDQ